MIPAFPALPSNDYESGLFKDGEALHDGKARRWECVRQLPSRLRFHPQQIENPPPGCIRKSVADRR